ncbi:NADH dehydrogenase [ubiquinone] 1 alpha subcomplex subunit 10, mitochondrial-like [Lineus longissimus]|uniref:NADH dehydrogenase [ubiquinone] 1 alpha subcomplex subunit 10, mitochondrial-like n=1 Tax=Lineus longissimus TaxID=88925 RepID=UPI00315D2DAF
MALFAARGNVGRFCLLASRSGKLVTPVEISQKMAGACFLQVAHITAPANQLTKVERAKPWPYKTLSYNIFWQLFDKTYKRIDENSKVICVEGNMGVGKTAFAQKLAEELDFHYVPMTEHDAAYWDEHKRFHLSELNPALPEQYQIFDLEQFYRQKNPESGRAGLLQLYWFQKRVFDYSAGLQHLFNTGQGVVFDRSPWSDHVWIEALRKCGFLKPGGYRYCMENRRIVMCEMFKPHVTVYLDSPVSKVMDNVKKRNIDYEVNSKIMSEKYVQEIDNAFKNDFLPLMKKHGEVLVYDANELEDWEIIVEDIERLNLEPDEQENEHKFIDWNLTREDDLAYYRKLFGWKFYIHRLFRLPEPWQSPECMIGPDEAQALRDAKTRYSRQEYPAGYNAEDSLFDKLFERNRSY